MAFTIDRTVIQPVTSQSIAHQAGYTSAEQDIGDDTQADQIWMYLDFTGYKAAPDGNKRILVAIQPVHTTAGTAYGDGQVQYVFSTPSDAAYNFAIPLCSLPRFFKVYVFNDNATTDTDDNSVNVRIELLKVTS